jgi:glyoxylase-like metal-dependent hydrolase (beta-lactamase superfamily II)/hemerythrin-like domain-containing protein
MAKCDLRSIEELHSEHSTIGRVLEQIPAALDPFDAPRVGELIEFLTRFVDGAHYEKDLLVIEGLLATVEGGERSRVLACREAGALASARIEEAARALDGADRTLLTEALTHASRAVERAIDLEERTLIPLADRLVPEFLDDELCTAFTEIDRSVFGAGGRERLRLLGEREPRPPRRSEPLDMRSLDHLGSELRASGSGAGSSLSTVLFTDEVHKNVLLPSFGRGLSVQSNQHLIIDGDEAMILDPGGPKIYPEILHKMNGQLEGARLRYIFLSHEDPDIVTALNAWLADTEADAYISRLWMRFLPHFAIDRLVERRLKPIPDEGLRVPLGHTELLLLPAHFLHSSGNFQVYDPRSKILYSGDLGSSIGVTGTFATDFDRLAPHMEGFHKRFMCSNAALRAWARMVRDVEIDCIAPQHGSIMFGRDIVERFISWCETLACGVDLMTDGYRIPP